MNWKKTFIALGIGIILTAFFWAYKSTTENRELKGEILGLKKQVAELGDSVKLLKNKFDTANLQLAEMKGRLEVQLTKNKFLENENKILQQDIKKYASQLSATQKKMDELNDKKKNLENRLVMSEKNAKINDDEKEELQRQKNEIDEELKLKNVEIVGLKNNLDTLSKKIVSVELEYSQNGVDYTPTEYGDIVKMHEARKVRITFNTVGNVEFKVQVKIYLNDANNPDVSQRTFSNGSCVFEFPNDGANNYRIEVWSQDLATLLFLVNKITISK